VARTRARGFKAMWQRLMRKFVDQGGERFTFHDLRAKAGAIRRRSRKRRRC
jgi:hypothetical protein